MKNHSYAKGIKYIYSKPNFILFTNKYLNKIFKAEVPPKNICFTLLLLHCLSASYFLTRLIRN